MTLIKVENGELHDRMSKSKSKFLPSPFLVNRAAPLSVSLALVQSAV